MVEALNRRVIHQPPRCPHLAGRFSTATSRDKSGPDAVRACNATETETVPEHAALRQSE